MGKNEKFKLTVEEANLLDRIASATKMDAWFYIDLDLHVHDIEEICVDSDLCVHGIKENAISSDAEGVCLLEDGLAYGLDEPQSGGLTPEEIRIVEACFKRARAAKDPKRYYSVPVVYEMYGSISVEASSAEEAYDKVRNHPEDFGLPDESFYVDDSLRVSDDDRENAVGTIKMLSCCDEDDQVEEAASGRRTGVTVKATVTFQRWEGDYARFNGEAEFDACDALDAMDDEMVRRVSQGEPYALDAVYKGAVRLGQIHDYDGPFEVDLDEEHLSDYLEARGNGR